MSQDTTQRSAAPFQPPRTNSGAPPTAASFNPIDPNQELSPSWFFCELESIFATTRQLQTAVKDEQTKRKSIETKLTQDRQSLQRELGLLRSQNQDMSQELEVARVDIKQKQELERKLSEQLKTLAEQCARFKMELQRTQQSFKEQREKISVEVENYKKTIRELQSRFQILETERNRSIQEKESLLQKHIQDSSERFESLKADYDEKLANLDQQITTLKGVEKKLKENLRAESETKSGLERQLAFINTEIRELKQEAEKTKLLFGKSREESEKYKTAYRELHEKSAGLGKSFHDLRLRESKLNSEAVELKMLNQTLEEELERCRAALKQARAQFDDTLQEGQPSQMVANKELALARKEIQYLKSEMDDLQRNFRKQLEAEREIQALLRARNNALQDPSDLRHLLGNVQPIRPEIHHLPVPELVDAKTGAFQPSDSMIQEQNDLRKQLDAERAIQEKLKSKVQDLQARLNDNLHKLAENMDKVPVVSEAASTNPAESPLGEPSFSELLNTQAVGPAEKKPSVPPPFTHFPQPIPSKKGAARIKEALFSRMKKKPLPFEYK